MIEAEMHVPQNANNALNKQNPLFFSKTLFSYSLKSKMSGGR